ncbi:MAG: lipoyl synthase [Planctomycetota bacterium]
MNTNSNESARDAALPRPPWLKVPLRLNANFAAVREIVTAHKLNTVCFSAACPNIGECWANGTATFMIGGNVCTRRCNFCDVITGRPKELDLAEPESVAAAIKKLGLRFAVVTAVARDDLADGGAAHMAQTVEAIRTHCPGVGVEVLIPDYKGDDAALGVVLAAGPDVLNHNIETVERLQRPVRRTATYARSLGVLRRAAELRPTTPTKSGIMLGLGEADWEVAATLRDLRAAGVALLTLGQYLSPSPTHLPVVRYVPPEEFQSWAERATALGFRDVAAGPLVRSSYHAEQLARSH